MLVCKDFTFDAAHNLINYNGRCEKLHGHTYALSVCIEGTINEKTGLVFDFLTLKEIVEKHVLQKLNHCYLNNFFPNPTTEIIAEWIFAVLEPLFFSDNTCLQEIKLSETASSHVIIQRK